MINVFATDPTKTTMLRKRFERELVRRFRKIARLIQEAVGENNDLALNQPRFDFPRSDQKVAAFMRWLRNAVEQEILEMSFGTPIESSAHQSWMNIYLRSAYQKGLEHAAQQIRRGGGEVSEQWIDSGFYRPIHADRAGLIFTRTFSTLKGITEAMDAAISETLAQGIVEGRGHKQIARMLVDRVEGIGIKRARVLARTETIRAHAEATLNTYQEAGIEGVKVQVEFTATLDNRVCPKCEELNGKVFTIKQSRGIIPVHPNCRCAWLPVVDAEGVVLNQQLETMK